MHKKYSSIVGPGAVILSAVLFGTMPLMAKQAFTLGSNAYTTAFGRFATGAVIAGLVILLHPKQTIRISKKQFCALLLLSLFYAATPVLLYSSYEDMVAEEARLTEDKISLEDFELELLNQKLQLIADSHHPTLTFTVFVPDQTKAGGSYIEITDTVKRVDMTAKKIVLISTRASGINNTIDFDKIIHISGDLVDYLDVD